MCASLLANLVRDDSFRVREIGCKQSNPIKLILCSYDCVIFKGETVINCPFFFFPEFYSFYEDADHYWDFNLPNNIVDNITSQQGSFSGDVIAKRSPTGNGLRVGLKAVINPLPEFGDECPVNPSLCTQGLTVSVFIKVMESEESDRHDHDREDKFLFGNINRDSHHIGDYNGFAVAVKGDRFLIIVNSQNHVCSSYRASIRRYLWSHLVFTWKDPGLPGGGLEIFVDSSRIFWKFNNDCDRNTGNRTLLRHLKIGSQDDDHSITAELDHLAIWYQSFQANNSILTAPWVHVRGKV